MTIVKLRFSVDPRISRYHNSRKLLEASERIKVKYGLRPRARRRLKKGAGLGVVLRGLGIAARVAGRAATTAGRAAGRVAGTAARAGWAAAKNPDTWKHLAKEVASKAALSAASQGISALGDKLTGKNNKRKQYQPIVLSNVYGSYC